VSNDDDVVEGAGVEPGPANRPRRVSGGHPAVGFHPPPAANVSSKL
jgi:hypothetical protein